MKILIVSDAWHPQINGVVRTYEYLSQELEKRGHSVLIIGPADFPFTIAMPGYPEIRLPLIVYKRLESLINTFNPDNIHIAVEGPLGWAARRYCLKHGRSFTTSYHTHFPEYVVHRLFSGSPAWLRRAVYQTAKAIIQRFHRPAASLMVATANLEQALQSWKFKTPLKRVTRGVNLDLYYPGPSTLFQGLARPVALYVGRLAVEKNIEDFLAMEWPGSKVVVGEGPSRGVFEQSYPSVIFTGRKTGIELAEHYRSSDVFIFPSRTDTFGLVLLEALASGLPVAAYCAPGPADIITEAFLGCLHPDDLAKAAHMALKCGNPDQRHAYVKNHYTWALAAQQFETVLLEEKASESGQI